MIALSWTNFFCYTFNGYIVHAENAARSFFPLRQDRKCATEQYMVHTMKRCSDLKIERKIRVQKNRMHFPYYELSSKRHEMHDDSPVSNFHLKQISLFFAVVVVVVFYAIYCGSSIWCMQSRSGYCIVTFVIRNHQHVCRSATGIKQWQRTISHITGTHTHTCRENEIGTFSSLPHSE